MIGLAILVPTTPSNAASVPSGSGQSATSSPQSARAVDVWARAGAPLVIPVRPTDSQRREGMVPARLSDGTTVFAPIRWIGPVLTPARESKVIESQQSMGARLIAKRAAKWMSVETEWESVPPAAESSRQVEFGLGGWYVIIDIPPGSEGKNLLLDGKQLEVGWIRPAPFSPPRRPGAVGGGWFEACVAAARSSPFSRWRARLAAGEPLVAPGPAQDEFGDNDVESLAEQIESQWSEALDRLSAADSVLASEVRRRLSHRLNFTGTEVPAWPTEDTSLERLMLDLLSPTASPAIRIQRAREWLQSQPRFAAWVASDAAIVDAANGRPAAAVAGVVLDPGSGPAAMMLTAPGSSRPQEIATLAPSLVGRTMLSMPGSPVEDAAVTVNISGWSARRAALPAALPARPPGLLFTGFLEEWTLPAWLASCTDSGDLRTGQSPAGRGNAVLQDDRQTAALLYAEDTIGAGVTDGMPRRWMLYVECRRPTEPRPDRSDEVLVGLSGPGGDIVLRVFPDGQVVSSRGTSSRVAAVAADDRWKAWVPLPEAIIADASLIRIGLVRTDAMGLRSSWPRPLFPWEDDPPRAAVNLSGWRGLSNSPG